MSAAGSPNVIDRPPWHTLPSEEVCARLQSGPAGLSAAAVVERRQRYGRNELPAPRPTSVARIFLRQFLSPLVYSPCHLGCGCG